MRSFTATLVFLIAASLAASAAFAASTTTPTRLYVKSPVARGLQGHLVAQPVGPGSHLCSITVFKSGPSHVLMRAKRVDRWGLGLYPKRVGPFSDGRIAWTWVIPRNTTLGWWRVRLSCGSAGSFRTSFKVVG